MSIGVQYDLAGVARLQERIAKLGNLDRRALLQQLAGVAESQTRERITSGAEKAPDGEPWQAWTARYAATRHGNNSMLDGEGNLADSITSEIEGDEALFHFADSASPALVTDSGDADALYVLMPLRV